MTTTFYADLPFVGEFVEITNPVHYQPIPDDWFVVLSDVTHSTAAIAEGKYKEVNFIGAATIVAVLNCARELELPFVFGGDGATLVIPPTLRDAAHQALTAVQALAEREYQFDLRIGMMRVREVYQHGYSIKVAKFNIADGYNQAMFSGDGLNYVESVIKHPQLGAAYRLHHNNLNQTVNLAGLECRWQSIPSRHGETVALLVRAQGSDDERNITYRHVLRIINDVYGDDVQHHPVHLSQLHLTANPRNLWVEAKTRAGTKLHDKLRYLLTIWLLNFVGMWLIWRKRKTEATDWAMYPKLLHATTDYKKYDEVLRMVIAGTSEQREQLNQELDKLYHRGHVAYGIHVSSHALMTCIVFERMGQQVHFIDAADGGYAHAALELKQRLAQLDHVSSNPREARSARKPSVLNMEQLPLPMLDLHSLTKS
ncbi:MAG: DUF3095 domain-containing protein [Herpetosiphon sp.]|nr:DUF3095 domain-containing protein [Herpetosiphon sp.]